MKTLIVYYSHSGNNQMLVDDLQKRLQCETLKIVESKRRKNLTILLDIVFNRTPYIQPTNKELGLFDHVIFVAPIWASRLATPLKSFLIVQKNSIKRYSFITVCSGTANQKRKVEDELIRLLGNPPVIVTELWINDLLPADQKNKIKYVTPYRLQPKDFAVFSPLIEKHVATVSKTATAW